MRKKTIYAILSACLVILTQFSCKKCKVCTCYSNAQSTEMENCAYGGGSSNQSLETWEKYLNEKECDSTQCRIK